MKQLLLLGAAFVAASAGQASAAETVDVRVQVHGYVALLCDVHSDFVAAQPAGPAQIDLGVISEVCNSGNGYAVWLEHTPGLHNATLKVDGLARPLSPTGMTLISQSATPGRARQHLFIDLGNSNRQLAAVSLHIMPR